MAEGFCAGVQPASKRLSVLLGMKIARSRFFLFRIKCNCAASDFSRTVASSLKNSALLRVSTSRFVAYEGTGFIVSLSGAVPQNTSDTAACGFQVVNTTKSYGRVRLEAGPMGRKTTGRTLPNGYALHLFRPATYLLQTVGQPKGLRDEISRSQRTWSAQPSEAGA